MTGKEQLEKIEVLRKKVEEQTYFVQELRSALDGVTGIDYDRERVQTSVSGDPMLQKLCRIEEEEEKLKQMIIRFQCHKVRMIRRIHKMDVGKKQTLLYNVYIERKSLWECTEIMQWSYDHTKKMHRLALEEFEMTPDDTTEHLE